MEPDTRAIQDNNSKPNPVDLGSFKDWPNCIVSRAKLRASFSRPLPVHRLAYSFGWDGSVVVPPGSSLVEIDLLEQPDGTVVRLTHTGLPNTEQCASHAEGWAHDLGRLAEVAAGRDPGPDPWHGRTGGE